jgi:hypothetical protein
MGEANPRLFHSLVIIIIELGLCEKGTIGGEARGALFINSRKIYVAAVRSKEAT